MEEGFDEEHPQEGSCGNLGSLTEIMRRRKQKWNWTSVHRRVPE